MPCVQPVYIDSILSDGQYGIDITDRNPCRSRRRRVPLVRRTGREKFGEPTGREARNCRMAARCLREQPLSQLPNPERQPDQAGTLHDPEGVIGGVPALVLRGDDVLHAKVKVLAAQDLDPAGEVQVGP